MNSAKFQDTKSTHKNQLQQTIQELRNLFLILILIIKKTTPFTIA